MAEPGFTPPKQRRSRDTMERFLRGARELLEERGLDGLTMDELARRSDVRMGSIYVRFRGKRDIVHAVQAQMLAEIEADLPRRFGDPSERDVRLSERVGAAVHAVADILREHAALLRVLIIASDTDDEMAAAGSRSTAKTSEHFAAAVLAGRDEIARGDPETAVDVCYRVVYDTLARRIMRGPTFETPRAIEWDRLVEELADMCAAYLLSRERSDASLPHRRRDTSGEF